MKTIFSAIAVFVLGIILAGITGIVTAAELPKWINEMLDLLSYLCYLGSALILLAGLWSYRKTITAWLNDLLKTQDEPEPALQPEETRPIQQAMTNLANTLAQLQPSVEEADQRLLDAKVWTDALVGQILAVVEKIESMEEQVSSLAKALDAVNGGDRSRVAYCAGKVTDQTIQRLLLSPHLTKREAFKTEAIILISNEIGALEQWSKSYEKFVAALCSQVIQVRNRTTALEQGVSMLQASHPILEINKNLGKAQEALQFHSRPSIRYEVRQSLPALSPYLLDR